MSSESRIWEIRPFGSMRGGRVLVIGLSAFQSILFRLLYGRISLDIRPDSASNAPMDATNELTGSIPLRPGIAWRKAHRSAAQGRFRR